MGCLGQNMLNSFEKMIVTSSLRGWVQAKYEMPWFRQMAALSPNARVLEAGCGNGRGIQLIYNSMGATQVDAFDIDPRMVHLSRQLLENNGLFAPLWQGSMSDIPAPSHTYDAVFCFGVLHHMGSWQLGIKEVHRVLRPGGLFYVNEYYRRLICHPVVRQLVKHPQHNRFSHQDLRQTFISQGFKVVAEKNIANLSGYWVVQKT